MAEPDFRYEPLQYSEYTAGEHFAEWHTDADDVPETDADACDSRGVAVVVLLSDDFLGGAFEVKMGRGRVQSIVPLCAGDAIGFPAKHLDHRVTPTTQGVRQSLVFWASSRPKRRAAQQNVGRSS